MAALSYNALHDPLTNLPNRRMLIEQLQLCLGEKAEGVSSDYAVLFLDIDRFSNVNDSAGHLVGDHILAAVSKRILEEIKDEAQGFVSRFGGDEFVILFKGQPTVPLALALAGRILAAIESPIGLRDQDYVLSASIGIVHGSALYREANELLRDADLAMYQAKKAGGGCVRVFDEALRLRQIQRHELERDLRKALVQDELLPYYQPIIDLRQGRCIGFEALVRWRHPTHGLISPDAFIPIAEESGLLPRLTLQMLRRSAEQLADWLARFPESFPLKMNVNIGARDLAAGLLTEEVEKILQGSPLDGASFTIEVTETGLIENVNTALEVIEQLRSRGLQIAIDDFGTGYSSLAYLRKLPVTIVKIDRSFVSSMHLDDRCYTIVDSIIALGKRMGFQIVAEGIENTHQLRLLKLLGCDHGQGYFFSRPLPAEEVEQTLLLGATALPGPAAHP
jgi:diguanylate cyclase (GGDEF)-like protein